MMVTPIYKLQFWLYISSYIDCRYFYIASWKSVVVFSLLVWWFFANVYIRSIPTHHYFCGIGNILFGHPISESVALDYHLSLCSFTIFAWFSIDKLYNSVYRLSMDINRLRGALTNKEQKKNLGFQEMVWEKIAGEKLDIRRGVNIAVQKSYRPDEQDVKRDVCSEQTSPSWQLEKYMVETLWKYQRRNYSERPTNNNSWL